MAYKGLDWIYLVHGGDQQEDLLNTVTNAQLPLHEISLLIRMSEFVSFGTAVSDRFILSSLKEKWCFGRICKDPVVLYLKALTGMPLEGLRKTTQNGR